MGRFSWLLPSRSGKPAAGGSLFAGRSESDETGELAKRYKITSMVGEGMIVGGPVVVRESLMVFGQLRAGVKATGEDSVLLLREGSVVLGDVIAATILVKGSVRGNLRGKMVRLYSGCRVFGHIWAENLVVDDGATIYNRSVKANVSGVDPSEVAAAQQQDSQQPPGEFPGTAAAVQEPAPLAPPFAPASPQS